MCWKLNYRDVVLNAVDVVKIWDANRRDNYMTGYTIDDIKMLASYREKIVNKMENLEKYGIDWIDTYQLKKWSKKMKKIMDRANLRGKENEEKKI